ncbi:hypothetical protein MMAN_06460 [Mycobacterium mantenii]|uniref:Uncharacterized protein n=1 Tax=Mycobacterium mantenii TaxID=560555 RepID=A0A1X0FX31_MYCNT|nr:hypothetical protein [Mycobacterium mantenii]MCV7242805.1 hypothetical protein [Mycobacterium mantenii]ORB06361.1 hypothetical protein BST30_10330 [Mycobacterium mantenii]BBY36512.1 hypothetical protein MMAN_06460 [Mycobacterium mantenii]
MPSADRYPELANIEFLDDLPPDARTLGTRNPLLAAFADRLRDHPQKWARWPVDDKKKIYGIASSANRGRGCFGPQGAFEAATRSGRLYVRYVGD